MLKGLIAYLRSPEEGKPFDCKPKSILSSFWLYLVAVFFITLLMGILVSALGRTFPTLIVTVGSCLFLLLGKYMLRCRFKLYFWFWGLFFGCLHLMNVNYAGFLPLDYVSLLLYTVTHTIMGLVLGYIRMKNSFAVSTSLHILNNLITVI